VHCPSCQADDTKVVDSRLAEEGAAVRRRRQCLSCSFRFTTYERLEELPLQVVKSDGSVQPFDRDKIVFGVRAASKGRSVSEEQIEQLAADVEDAVRAGGGEISSTTIGLAVLDRLRVVDEVAYLRFASVYKNFDNRSDFETELALLSKLGPAANG
jgi:transcriptional repressor NrdR